MAYNTRRFAWILLAGVAGGAAADTDTLRVGTATLDEHAVTARTISVILPVRDADGNFNGRVRAAVRAAGTQEWQPRPDLFRHRNGLPRLSQPFAGMIWGLEPDTAYEIRLTAADPDGVEGPAAQVVRGRTRKRPAVFAATTENTVAVSSRSELDAALKNARPGRVVLLKKGRYSGNLAVADVAGTEGEPIVLRGEHRRETIIDGAVTVGSCEHLHIEDLTIQNGNHGINLSKRCTAVVIRGCIIRGVNQGIYAKNGHRHLYLRNNVIVGNNAFGDTRRSTWNDEGIVLTGSGHEASFNTIAGFGDSLGFSHRTGGLVNTGVDLHHNLVLWGGDDGVEMDYTDRSCAVHHNLFANHASGLSFQMVVDGPAYGFRNVMYNLERGPYKIKPERSENDGVFIYNNTTVKAGTAYVNWSVEADGAAIVNNLFVGTGGKLLVQTGGRKGFRRLVMDYNAWSYDGGFSMRNCRAKNFREWKERSPRGNHDVLLAGETIFEKLAPDFAARGFGYYRDVGDADFTLHPHSSAVDAGMIVPGITDGFTGDAPDIGAWERGVEPPRYGVDFAFDLPPEQDYTHGTKAAAFGK